MRQIITIYIVLFISLSSFAQQRKTLQDTVFQKGDIFIIPQYIFNICRPGFQTISQQDSLKPTADFLNKHKNVIVEIGVHSDSRGSKNANTDLTTLRAKEIRNYLISYFGLDTTRVLTKGYGETKLLVSDQEIMKAKTKEEKENLHAMNRRFEMKILEIK